MSLVRTVPSKGGIDGLINRIEANKRKVDLSYMHKESHSQWLYKVKLLLHSSNVNGQATKPCARC
jgi:hypothetical protein